MFLINDGTYFLSNFQTIISALHHRNNVQELLKMITTLSPHLLSPQEFNEIPDQTIKHKTFYSLTLLTFPTGMHHSEVTAS